MYKFLCGYMLLFFAGYLSGHIVALCLIEELSDYLKHLHHFAFPPAVYEDEDFSTTSIPAVGRILVAVK